MSKIVEAFDQLFAEKKVPIEKKIVNDDLVLYRVDFTLKTTHTIRMEMIFQCDHNPTDVQISYRYVGFLKDYHKREELLSVINDLNEVQSGYYRLYLAGDGEIYLKLLTRVYDHIDGVYDMMLQGPAIARHVLADLERVTGEFNNMTDF